MAPPPLLSLLLLLLLLLLAAGAARADLASDRSECADQLVGLAACLPYVQGEGRAPTPDCCSGLRQVMSSSPKCLCVLIKDRDDPQLGIKLNASLALNLPKACAAHADISQCPKILNLPAGSKDAAIFEQGGGAAAAKGNATTGASSGTAAAGGGKAQAEASGGTSVDCEGLLVAARLVLLPLLLLSAFVGSA